jgi:hypothetical protein
MLSLSRSLETRVQRLEAAVSQHDARWVREMLSTLSAESHAYER